MNDPNDATCFVCKVKCMSYDAYMFAWHGIADKADFCSYCTTEILQNFYDCNAIDILRNVPSIEVRDIISRSMQKRG
jgi:hypothetical protein